MRVKCRQSITRYTRNAQSTSTTIERSQSTYLVHPRLRWSRSRARNSNFRPWRRFRGRPWPAVGRCRPIFEPIGRPHELYLSKQRQGCSSFKRLGVLIGQRSAAVTMRGGAGSKLVCGRFPHPPSAGRTAMLLFWLEAASTRTDCLRLQVT